VSKCVDDNDDDEIARTDPKKKTAKESLREGE
jgi:hypothetical protein